jgi:hypothetical protein
MKSVYFISYAILMHSNQTTQHVLSRLADTLAHMKTATILVQGR